MPVWRSLSATLLCPGARGTHGCYVARGRRGKPSRVVPLISPTRGDGSESPSVVNLCARGGRRQVPARDRARKSARRWAADAIGNWRSGRRGRGISRAIAREESTAGSPRTSEDGDVGRSSGRGRPRRSSRRGGRSRTGSSIAAAMPPATCGPRGRGTGAPSATRRPRLDQLEAGHGHCSGGPRRERGHSASSPVTAAPCRPGPERCEKLAASERSRRLIRRRWMGSPKARPSRNSPRSKVSSGSW